MTQEEYLIQQLSACLVEQFPDEMESPLVAAGVFGTKSQRFYTVGKNVMRLLPTSGYDTIHAEEEALEAFLRDPCAPLEEPLYVVTSLEPCHPKRSPKEKLACAKRIFEFTKKHRVEKVIIGMLQTGRGLSFLLEQNLEVVLVHGPAHQKNIYDKHLKDDQSPNPIPILDTLRRKKASLEVIETELLDLVNREEHQRFLLSLESRSQLTEAVLQALRQAASMAEPFQYMLGSFPELLKNNDEADFLESLQVSRATGQALEDLLASFFRTRVYNFLGRFRSKQIEQELRSRAQSNARPEQ